MPVIPYKKRYDVMSVGISKSIWKPVDAAKGKNTKPKSEPPTLPIKEAKREAKKVEEVKVEVNIVEDNKDKEE